MSRAESELESREAQPFALETRPDCVGLGLMVKQQARGFGWPEVECAEVALLVIELTTNAINHGKGGTCRVAVSEREVWLEVTDRGPGFPAWVLDDVPKPPEPEPSRPRTRGLGAGIACARRLAHLLRLENPPAGGARVVAARYRLKRHATEEAS